MKQFNTIKPQTFEANRTQVNINIVPSSRTDMNGNAQEGYEYTTVVFENSMMYTDEALIELANKQEAQSYLNETDWITSKYNDVVTVLGTMSKADFVAKYKEIYDNRTAARAVLSGGN